MTPSQELRAVALQAAATRRSGLSEIYSEEIFTNTIRDAEVYLRWLMHTADDRSET